MNTAQVVPPRRLWWLGVGFTLWCLALVVLYALHAIGCAFAWPQDALRTTLGVVFIAFLAILGGLWRRHARTGPDPAQGEGGRFLHQVVLWTLVTAWVSSLLTLGPPLLLSVCN